MSSPISTMRRLSPGPGRIAGIQVDDLDKQLEGMKTGETRTLTVQPPTTHPNEQLRGKDVQIEIALKDIKKLELAEMIAEFLDRPGLRQRAGTARCPPRADGREDQLRRSAGDARAGEPITCWTTRRSSCRRSCRTSRPTASSAAGRWT